MDTIAYRTRSALRPAIADSLAKDGAWKDDLAGWRFNTKTAHSRGADGLKTSFAGYHEPSRTKVSGCNGLILKVTTSLPRILHGINSICIKYDEQDDAVSKLRELVRQVSGPETAPWNMDRWDFAIQIRCDVRKVLAIYRDARTKYIFGSPAQYKELGSRRGNALQWTGKDVTITLYDKGAERNAATRGKPPMPEGVVLRIEISIRKEAIAKHLPSFTSETGEYFPLPSYLVGWKIFREIVTSLDPKSICDAGRFKIETMCAYTDHMGYTAPVGGSFFEWWARGKNPDTVRRMRKKVQSIVLTFAQWSFEQELPANYPSTLVDILQDHTLLDVPNPFS